MLKKIAFFSIMVEKTCISAYFCSMTYKKTNRRDDDSRGSQGRGAEKRGGSANSKNDRGAERAGSREQRAGSREPRAESSERGAGSRDRKPYSSDRPERKNYSSDRPERKSYNSDRPARSDERGADSRERGAGSRDRKPYSSDRPERKSYNSDRPERSDERGADSRERGAGSRDRKPYSSDRPERKNYSSDRPERKSYNSDRPARSDERGADSRERGAGSRDRKPYSSDKPKRKSSTSRTPAPKPGPFDKFNIDKMREAKAESMEKKERKRPNRGRDAERGRDSANSKDFRGAERAGSRERGAGSRERGAGSRERGAGSRERGEEKSERTSRPERAERAESRERSAERPERSERPERRAETSGENSRSKGVERRKTDPDEEIRLNRYIANSGVCSRRKADELIEKGEVTVNDEVIRELGYKVKYSDKIKFEGKLLKPGNLVYILLNKPKDYITTTDDPMERRTVLDLTAKITNERIFPVGRLDRNTTGLLLLTNDGDLADKLSHPRNQVRKVYEVELDKSLIAKDFEQVRDGVELEDGFAKVDQISYLDGKSKKFVGVEIHIGRNRIVRRIFESLGYEVVRLDRVIYAGLTKKDLSRGRCRMLSKEELIYLKHLNKY